MKTIQYGLLVFRQNDEVYVDGMDVHAVAYQRLNHNISQSIITQGIYGEMKLLNYSKNMSLFNNYKM